MKLRRGKKDMRLHLEVLFRHLNLDTDRTYYLALPSFRDELVGSQEFLPSILLN